MTTAIPDLPLDYRGGIKRLKEHLDPEVAQTEEFRQLASRFTGAIDHLKINPTGTAAQSRWDEALGHLLDFIHSKSPEISFEDLCRTDYLRREARSSTVTGLRDHSIEALKTAAWYQRKVVECEVPIAKRRGQTDEEKELERIERHIKFLKNYSQLGQFKKEGNWSALVTLYKESEADCYPGSARDPERYLAWAEYQAKVEKQCKEIERLIENDNILQALQECHVVDLENKDDENKYFAIVEELEQRFSQLRTKALDREIDRAIGQNDWLRAVQILTSITNQINSANQRREYLDRMKKEYLNKHFRLSVNLFSPSRDYRPGVKTLDIVWGLPLPLPSAERYAGETFQIASFPVTVWQFQQFVLQDGYAAGQYWTNWGTQWLNMKKVVEPEKWRTKPSNVYNQPVVGVSWYEAQAFCHWLTQYHRAWGWLSDNEEIRLPTITEWIEAARRRPSSQREEMLEETLIKECDKIQYKLEEITKKYIHEKWDSLKMLMRRNYKESNWRRPIPVGVFPENVSPCGAYDMAGNVWEWCSSGKHERYEREEDRYLDPDARATLSMSDFNYLPDSFETPDCCGGSFKSKDGEARWDSSTNFGPDERLPDVGFRLCRAPKRK